MRNLFFTALILTAMNGIAQNDEQYPGCLDSLNIPAIVTPNGDNLDDILKVDFPCAPENFVITIFNRWGSEIWKSNNPGFIWDAKSEKGEPVPEGVYYCTITFEYLGEKKVFKSYFNVVF